MNPACVWCWGHVAPPRVHCAACLDEIGKLYRKVCQVTTRYAFAAPVEPADLDHVRAELESALPPGHRVTLTLAGRVVLEIARSDGRRYYRQEFIIQAVP